LSNTRSHLKDLEGLSGGVSKSVLCSLAAAQAKSLRRPAEQRNTQPRWAVSRKAWVALPNSSLPTSSSPRRACGC